MPTVVEKSSDDKFKIFRELLGSPSSSLERVLHLTDGFTNIIIVSFFRVESHEFSNSCKIFLRNTLS